jgi:uncharacterized protein VirK/YbjX
VAGLTATIGSALVSASHVVERAFDRDLMFRVRKVLHHTAGTGWMSMAVQHAQVMAMMGHPQTRRLTTRYPEMVNKYLSSCIARSFCATKCREGLKFHYRHLQQRLNENFFSEILSDQVALWRMAAGGEDYAIVLMFNADYHWEGDLSLIMLSGGTRIYEISFSVLPGMLVGSAAETVLFVTRVQGVKDRFDDIRRATKFCRQVAPAHLLVAAAQGVADVLDISVMGGINNAEQLCADRTDEEFRFDYDGFWETFSAARTRLGFYSLDLPLQHKPIEEIPRSRRRRTRLKRQFKEDVAAHAGATFKTRFVNSRQAIHSVRPIPSRGGVASPSIAEQP